MLLGVFTVMAYGPVIAVSFLGGLLADRFDKRDIATLFQAWIVVLFLGLAAFSWSRSLPAVFLLVAALIESVCYALAKPSVQAVLYDVVETKDLGRAVPWNTSQYSVAQIIGPVVAILIMNALNLGAALIVAGFLYVPIIITMQKSIPDPRPDPKVEESPNQQTAERHSGLGVLAVYLLSVALGSISVEGSVRVLAPAIAEDVSGSAKDAGLLISGHAVGGILGIVVVIFGQRILSGQTLYRVGFAGLSICIVIFSFARSLAGVVVIASVIGMMNAISFNIATTLIHRQSTRLNRGRAMSLHNIALLGTRPIAGIITGALAANLGWSVSSRLFAVTALVPLAIDLIKSSKRS